MNKTECSVAEQSTIEQILMCDYWMVHIRLSKMWSPNLYLFEYYAKMLTLDKKQSKEKHA